MFQYAAQPGSRTRRAVPAGLQVVSNRAEGELADVGFMRTPVAKVDGEQDADELLMARYAEGNEAAFRAIYARHKGALYRYFRRQLTEDVANDCFQNLWLRVINARATYRPSAPFRHYLFTLAHR